MAPDSERLRALGASPAEVAAVARAVDAVEEFARAARAGELVQGRPYPGETGDEILEAVASDDARWAALASAALSIVRERRDGAQEPQERPSRPPG